MQPDDLGHVPWLAPTLAALVAWRTRNIAATLVVGMGVLMVLEAL